MQQLPAGEVFELGGRYVVGVTAVVDMARRGISVLGGRLGGPEGFEQGAVQDFLQAFL